MSATMVRGKHGENVFGQIEAQYELAVKADSSPNQPELENYSQINNYQRHDWHVISETFITRSNRFIS